MSIDICSIASLSEAYAIIRVSGVAAQSFLQGQLTCDVNHLQDTMSCLTAHCNTKGRVRTLYRIFRQDGDFYLRCPKSMVDKALSFLQFYARFSKVTLTVVNHAYIYGLCVPIEQASSLPFPTMAINQLIQIDRYTIIKVPGNTDLARYELYLLPNNPAIEVANTGDALKAWLIKLNNITANTWALTDIMAKIPEIFPETSEQFLPHYLGLPELEAISFNKGCYIGQEIIARMEYRSKQKKYQLSLIKTNLKASDNILKSGDTLPDGVSKCVRNAVTEDGLWAYTLIQAPTSSD
ncbi:MAG: tRNA-modifying protein YgfZ [Pseudomonadota bacterium]|jgi:folate-binding protein YgfZ